MTKMSVVETTLMMTFNRMGFTADPGLSVFGSWSV